MTVKLALPMRDFENMHAAMNKSRGAAGTVAVSKRALAAMLEDHSKMVRALEDANIEIEADQ